MTIDRSLRVRAGMLGARSVLTRGERLQKLKEAEVWHDGDSVFGLPKVRVMRTALKKKKKAKAEEAEEGAEGAAAPVAAAAAGKTATPAKGAAKTGAAKAAPAKTGAAKTGAAKTGGKGK